MNMPITANGWLQIALYFTALLVLIKPLGAYMARVYTGEQVLLSPVLGRLESGFHKICGINPDKDMAWKDYAISVIVFSMSGFALLFLLLLFQGGLPLNPDGMAGLSPDLAFNTAVSFISNTNWQSYGGESTMSHFTQMFGLTVQNFISASVGMAVLIAMIRGFTRRNAAGIGNFWVDMLRGNLYILLPLALLWSLLLTSQGVVQSFDQSIKAETLEAPAMPSDAGSGKAVDATSTQTIAVGPAASQIAIKQLGTNGGGFFNANSAHPFENPTPFSNFLEMLAILLIPASLCYTFGQMVGDRRQGWALLGAMTVIFVPLMLFASVQEQAGNPAFNGIGIDQVAGNMEGKEVRFGIINSTLWASATTAASNGSVNAMHGSFTPLGGLVPLVLMQFGEVIYGGVGSGLYGMLVFVMLTVFICGLMVGRTPEYLGKKIQAYEIKMASLVILIPCAAVLLGTALAVSMPAGRAGILNPGAHGFSEILYALTSASNNNGSAFAGLSANTPFYNSLLGICMLLGRYWIIIPVLAIAGSLAAKNTVPVSAGTLPTHTPLFVACLVGIILLVGLLTFVPALALGPVAAFLNLA